MRKRTSNCLDREGAITVSATFATATAVSRQPRAVGNARIAVKRSGVRSALSSLYQSGASKILLPHSTSPDMTAVILNTAGGVTGGDRIDLTATAEPDSCLTLTTQTAERIYRAQPGEVGAISTQLNAQAGARINWLPQETILFDHCALRRRLAVDLAETATFLMVEPVVFGRKAMGEDVNSGTFLDKVDIRRNGTLCFADATRLTGNIGRHLDQQAIGDRARAMASVLYAAENADTLVDRLRDIMPTSGGVSLIRPGILFCRILAEDSYVLRQSLIPVIQTLTGAPLPKTWTL